MHDMTDIVTSGEIFMLAKGKIFLSYFVALIAWVTAQGIIGCVL